MTQKITHTEGESNTSAARARWQAENAGARSAPLLQRDAEAFLHQSLSSPCVSTIAKAEGIWIEDLDGRRYMDFHGNSVHHLGYGHPRLVAAIKEQLDDLPFAPRRFTNEPAVALAEKLGDIAPGDLNKVLFTTGGSDANEVALKIARAATGRFKTISFWDAFHGAGLGAASVGGEATFRSHIAGPLLPGTEHVAPFACYRCPYNHAGPDVCGLACANMVDYVLQREGDVAAVIAEPMRAVPNVPPPGYWKSVREACDRHGALLILDEIPTGLGKTGRMFAFEHDGVVPDIVTLGKALGGGILPIAACIAPQRSRCLWRLRYRPLHPRKEPGNCPRGTDDAGDYRGGGARRTLATPRISRHGPAARPARKLPDRRGHSRPRPDVRRGDRQGSAVKRARQRPGRNDLLPLPGGRSELQDFTGLRSDAITTAGDFRSGS